MKYVYVFLLIFAVSLSAFFAWPTPHRYDHMRLENGDHPVRISRISGQAEMLYPEGWVLVDTGNPFFSSEDLPFSELLSVRAQFNFLDPVDPGSFECQFYNASLWIAKELTVRIHIEKENDQQTMRAIRIAGKPCLPMNFCIFKASTGGFIPHANDKWTFEIIHARGRKARIHSEESSALAMINLKYRQDLQDPNSIKTAPDLDRIEEYLLRLESPASNVQTNPETTKSQIPPSDKTAPDSDRRSEYFERLKRKPLQKMYGNLNAQIVVDSGYLIIFGHKETWKDCTMDVGRNRDELMKHIFSVEKINLEPGLETRYKVSELISEDGGSFDIDTHPSSMVYVGIRCPGSEGVPETNGGIWGLVIPQ